MRFIPTIFLCNFLLLIACQIQAVNTDSLQRVIEHSKGKQKIDAQNSLSWNLKYNHPVRAKKLSLEVLKASQKLDYHKGIMIANRNLAAIEFLQGKIDTCLHYAQIALNYAIDLKDTFQQGKIYNLMGISYRSKQNISRAMEYHNKAIEKFRLLNDSSEIIGNMHNKAILFEAINDYVSAYKIYQNVLEFELRQKNAEGISRTAIHLGSIAEKNHDYFNAIRYFKMGMKYARETNNVRWYSAGLHDIASVYVGIDSLDKAKEYYHKALDINRKNKFKTYEANNLFSLGNFYSERDYQKAENYYSQALKIYETSGLIHEYVNTLLGLSSIYRNTDKIFEAEKLANSALKIADSLRQTKLLSSAYYELYLLSKSKKRFKTALSFLEKYKSYQDSLNAIKKEELLSTLQARYDFEKMEKENENLKHKNKLHQIQNNQQRVYLIVTFIIIFLVLSLAIVLFISFRKIKKLNNKLEWQQLKIQRQAKELQNIIVTKNKFFSIIAHDLKNPFNGILGFSELLLSKAKDIDDKEVQVFADSIYRSSSELYELLENLLNWSKSQRGDFNIVLKEDVSLYKETQKAINQLSWSAKEKNITVENNINENLLVKTDKNVLQTVIRNLLNNAIKYSQKMSVINIAAYQKQNKVIFFVRDHGLGMPKDVQKSIFSIANIEPEPGTVNEKGSGLGLALCKELLDKQGDDIWFKSEEGKGSTFFFSLKLS